MKLILLFFISTMCFAEYAELRTKARNKDIQLSSEELELLENGKISGLSYVAGGIVGTYPLGLGIGHAIQGRYASDGWKFTVGEIGSIGVALIGANSCSDDIFSESRCDTGLIIAGVVGFIGFRIWEIIDVWATPPKINRRYDQLKDYINQYEKPKVTFNLAPIVSRENNLGLGLNIRF